MKTQVRIERLTAQTHLCNTISIFVAVILLAVTSLGSQYHDRAIKTYIQGAMFATRDDMVFYIEPFAESIGFDISRLMQKAYIYINALLMEDHGQYTPEILNL